MSLISSFDFLASLSTCSTGLSVFLNYRYCQRILRGGRAGSNYEIHVEFLKLSSSQSLTEIVTIVEAFNFDSGADLRGQCTLGFLNLTLQFTHGFEVFGDVDVILLVVLFGQVVDDSLITGAMLDPMITVGLG